MSKSILIIDDKIKICRSLSINFEQSGYSTASATDPEEALKVFRNDKFDIVILDLMLGEKDSRELLRQLLSIRRDIPVIMITGYASIETAVDTIKIGAYDYIQKPVDFDVLLDLVEKAVRAGTACDDEEGAPDSGRFLTRNNSLKQVLARAAKLAATDLPVLILGENGTGKEVLADYIHEHSSRSNCCLHRINCAAFQESILDNELFGHNKGAYTGASSDYKGIFERASGGNLFLDEIGDMSLSIQAKILRTLQNKEVRRIGGDKTITVDVRFIAATNKDLEELIRQKLFREDLFYRLSTAVIKLPPLRERKEDIPLLSAHFIEDFCRDRQTGKKLAPEVLSLMIDYGWPGNIRELKNTIQYACAVSTAGEIRLEDLPQNFQDISRIETEQDENIREEMEKQLIMNILLKNDYNKTRTAEELHMSRKTLYNKLERYGISER